MIPVGDREIQCLEVIVRNGSKARTQRLVDCAFVPLVGREGWNR